MEEEPGDTNPDRKCARERLPRYDIAITNREASDEGEIDRVADRPALDKRCYANALQATLRVTGDPAKGDPGGEAPRAEIDPPPRLR
jgi:hypothetical protein